jgi:hypothetical protein
MRFLVAAALCVAMIVPAKAADVSVKLADGTQNAIIQLPAVFDQCVAGLTIRGDASVCKNLATFLVGMSNEVKSAQAEAVAKAAADKATADKAAAPATPPAN